MEMELGKLFIGGISWDTNEDSLRNYFQAFGEVVEVVIMKDRATGRARGFGFVVFADPCVAERVVMKKHLIDGRNVEAKKAVPREDQNLLNRNSGSNIHGSLGPARTKKIFVGGLASTVTESDFKKYFDQFGTITDVIVMYDHNTQRPRGFGFITYDSEEAVERVLQKTFHELNGKMVEVKWAVPKELSLVQPRSPLTGFNFSPSRVSSFLHGYNQGYSSNSTGGLGSRMDGRFSPVPVVGQSTFSPFGPGFAINFDQRLSPSYGGNSNLSSNLGYGRLSPSYNGNLTKYESPIGYSEGNGGESSLFNSPARMLWENRNINNASISTKSDSFMGTRTENSGVGLFGGIGGNWGSSANSGQGGSDGSAYSNRYLSYRSGDLGVNLGGVGFGRYNGVSDVPISSLAASNVGNSGPYRDIFENGSLFGDSTWLSSSLELEGSGSLGFGIGNAASDVASKNSAGYAGGYSVANRQANRGIAA
ncbi:heterogeneous nuclear ribonucleoprotein 1-like [Euphorbia lathyris]|uniref:heterogeneous nuclear ribonucleoprotein 1-like n=1 Tax=Euphorbia lathyris TaxID=212925 RepID=UPI0033137B15